METCSTSFDFVIRTFVMHSQVAPTERGSHSQRQYGHGLYTEPSRLLIEQHTANILQLSLLYSVHANLGESCSKTLYMGAKWRDTDGRSVLNDAC